MEVKANIESFAKIKVIGVGGSGGSAVNRMINSKIRGVDFLVANTDIQALHHSQAPIKLQIGKSITKGLGAGMDPELGKKAAEENQNEIRDALAGADMVFITCGLGGGTGTGAAPVIAELAKDIGALTIAVVGKPFTFEGAQRKAVADKGWDALASKVDAIITVPNDKILQVSDKKTTVREAFEMADEVLQKGVRGISELITIPGEPNLDFNDVRAIMKGAGTALMGIGIGSGENRAVEAAKMAIASPLLDISIEGARGVLFTITGSSNLGILEINEAAKIITSSTDPEARVIFGVAIDDSMDEDVRITVIATGFNDHDNIVSKASYEKVYAERMPTMNSQMMFSPAAPRTAAPKIIKEEVRPRSDDKPDSQDDIEIPAFIRKKMM